MTVSRLLTGIVVESTVPSLTGEYLYSDFAIKDAVVLKNSTLNNLVQIPFLGIAVGVARVALAVIHSLGHLMAYPCTKNRGHLYHAAKGGGEALRGMIEALPVLGRLFAWIYNPPIKDGRNWWMIKMYNPNKPDGLDDYMEGWNEFKRNMPHLYVNANGLRRAPA